MAVQGILAARFTHEQLDLVLRYEILFTARLKSRYYSVTAAGFQRGQNYMRDRRLDIVPPIENYGRCSSMLGRHLSVEFMWSIGILAGISPTALLFALYFQYLYATPCLS